MRLFFYNFVHCFIFFRGRIQNRRPHTNSFSRGAKSTTTLPHRICFKSSKLHMLSISANNPYPCCMVRLPHLVLSLSISMQPLLWKRLFCIPHQKDIIIKTISGLCFCAHCMHRVYTPNEGWCHRCNRHELHRTPRKRRVPRPTCHMHCTVYTATEDAKEKKTPRRQVWQRTLPFLSPPKGDEPEATGPMCGNAAHCPPPDNLKSV